MKTIYVLKNNEWFKWDEPKLSARKRIANALRHIRNTPEIKVFIGDDNRKRLLFDRTTPPAQPTLFS